MPTIYLPVPTQEMRNVAATWNQGRLQKNKPPYQVVGARHSGIKKAIRRARGHGALRNIGAGEKIYILSHGLKGVGGHNQPALRIGNRWGAHQVPGQLAETWAGGHQKVFRAVELARHLDHEGLTHGILRIHLFCCSAGVPVPGNTSYAQAFKQALTARGFNAVTVFAYLGDLSAGYNNRMGVDGYDRAEGLGMQQYTRDQFKGVQGDDHRMLPAKSRRVQF